MALELLKENMVVEQVVGENRYQALISHDIVIGDNRPDVDKILSVSARNNIIRQETIQGKAVIEGMLDCSVLYTGDTDKLIECVEAHIPYTQYVDVKGAEAKMICEVSDTVESADAAIVNARKISLNVLVDLNVKVLERKSVDVIEDITGLPDMQILRENIKISNTLGEGTSQDIIREELELPQNKLDISEIIKAGIDVVVEKVVVTSGKVTAEGYVSLDVMYYTGESVHPLEKAVYELPFAQETDVQGAEEGMSSEVRFYVDDTSFRVAEDAEGKNRIINAEILLKCVAKVYREDEREVIVDAYSPMRATRLSKSAYRCRELVGRENSQVEVKDTLTLIQPATSMYDVSIRPVIIDYSVSDGKVVSHGVLQVAAVYMTSTGDTVVTGEIQEIPFNVVTDVPGATKDAVAYVGIIGSKSAYELKTSRQLELKSLLDVEVTVYADREIQLVTGVEELDVVQPERPSITVYMVQKGDELWDIAKKYRTTVDDILEHNNVQREDIKSGLKLIIPKKFL
ncbi:DUF3794 and LysM peptidoglycan-binding domain-containing protein [Caldanaerobius polysaccharolyticus]|uniref:DUF3794 and LysM peptidoglycan-binding domain-containing protein n=1 Tax=Caldanaerobius polysaccharolyticus TaxID=44256 RepID=UPI00047BEE07|nr:SPOCS domain-containing protein [Caldanaerobius polysaccharolyticus]